MASDAAESEVAGGGGWLQSSGRSGSSGTSSGSGVAGLALFLVGGCSFAVVVAATAAARGIRVGRDGVALAGGLLGLLLARAVAGGARRRRRRGSRSILGRAGRSFAQNVTKGGLVGFGRALVVVETDHPTGIQVGGFHHLGDEASLVDVIGRFLKKRGFQMTGRRDEQERQCEKKETALVHTARNSNKLWKHALASFHSWPSIHHRGASEGRNMPSSSQVYSKNENLSHLVDRHDIIDGVDALFGAAARGATNGSGFRHGVVNVVLAYCA